MNYQPFLDANLLISDPLLLQLKALMPAFALLALLTFYALLALHMVVYFMLRAMRPPNRNYPAHENKAVSNA